VSWAAPRTRLSFDQQARLTGRHQFNRVFQRPMVSRDNSFRILYRSNGGPRSRLGLAVPKKVCKTAVGRHRLKRIVRESFRLRQAELAGSGAVDIVVLPSISAADEPSSALRASLERHWTRISALTQGDARAAGAKGPGKRQQQTRTRS
jgi:ribonuclease P protein component